MSYQVRVARRALQNTFESNNIRERGEVLQHKNGPLGFSTVDVLQRFCEINSIECNYASEYGEPGYTQPEKGILLSNWNDIPKTLATRLEQQGYELEWSDEWYVDGGRTPAKAYRTQADSHGWESRLLMTDGDYLTPDDDPQEWIDEVLNEDSRPLPSWFDDSELESRGFGLMSGHDKQVGFHPGQNETPDKFMPALRAEGYDVVLQVTGRSQFDVAYRVWTRKEADESTPGAKFCEFEDIYYVAKE